MNLREKFNFRNATYLFLTIFYLVIGIWVIAVANQVVPDKKTLLGVLIILSSVPHVLIYVINRTKTSYLIIGLVGTAFGILFLSTGLFNEDQICMVWGCIDICRGTTEIINVAPTVREKKSELVEIAISIGDIVIGVLLCIHLAGGIKIHLIYLGVAFLISAIKNVAECIIGTKKND